MTQCNKISGSVKIFVFAVLLVGMSADLWARSGSRIVRRPVNGGIVFPSFSLAPLTNASYLPEERARAVHAQYAARNAPDYTSHDGIVSIASSDNNFGYGVGYIGSHQNEQLTSGMFLAFGANSDVFGFGLTLADTDVSNSFSPSMTLSLRGKGNKMFYQALFRDLNSSARLDLGLGLTDESNYTLELNLNIPPFSTLQSGTADYTFVIALTAYADNFAASAKSEVDLGTVVHRHRIGLSFFLADFFYVTAEVFQPLRYQLSLTIGF